MISYASYVARIQCYFRHVRAWYDMIYAEALKVKAATGEATAMARRIGGHKRIEIIKAVERISGSIDHNRKNS